jgi:hypothetical protein
MPMTRATGGLCRFLINRGADMWIAGALNFYLVAAQPLNRIRWLLCNESPIDCGGAGGALM